MANAPKLSLLIEVDKKTGKIKVAQQEIEGLGLASEKAGDSAKAGSAGFGALAKSLAPILAARSIFQFFSDATKAAVVQQDAVSKLNAALANQGALTKETSEDLQRYAASLQKVTRFGDETILSAQSMLASFGLTGDELKKATAAALDMSTALKVDLKSSAILLGKAFAGETSSLSRYGIIIDDNIPKTEKFSAVIEKLNKNFGGAAQADAKTFGGSVQQLKNEFGDLTEKIGFQLIPTLTRIGTTVKDVLPFFLRFSSVITGIVSTTIESFNFVGKTIQRIVESITEIITTAGLNIRDILSGNMDDAIVRVNTLRGNIAKNLSGLVDDATNTSGALKDIAKNTWETATATSNDALKVQEEQLAQSLAVRESKEAEAAAKREEAKREQIAKSQETQAAIDAFELEAQATKEDLAFEKFKAGIEKRAAELEKAAENDVQRKTILDSKIALIEAKREKIKAKLEKEQEAKRLKRQAQEFGAAVKFSGSLVSLTKGKNKEINEIAKQAEVADALRTTFQGANKALGQGGFFGFGMAAAVIAAGLANVAKIEGFAKGGITPGGTVLVGEQGPELANLPAGTRITPANKTREILGSDRPITINLTVNNNIVVENGEDVAEQVVDSINASIDQFNPAVDGLGRSIRDLIDRQGARAS